ncbi:hypothetical protein VP01_5846g1 [Puccinia sorghi]|uniref:Uncharacterized protein n=1 Tax=Puccinia sorghi TaxID=27349 RepID=A0A0L6UI48_9BASI|nr:hypothetical protein VP01_5846g1 [Puccinia sorghi]
MIQSRNCQMDVRSFDKCQFDGGSEEDEDFLTYPTVESPRSDCVSDIDFRELAEVVELFKVENLDRSDDSTEDLAAKLLWEEIEETKSVKNAERILIDDVPDKGKANGYQFKWHPYGSQEKVRALVAIFNLHLPHWTTLFKNKASVCEALNIKLNDSISVFWNKCFSLRLKDILCLVIFLIFGQYILTHTNTFLFHLF